MISPSPRRRLLVAVATVSVLCAACAGLDGPQRITFSLADIGRLLERQFPQDRRVLEVLDVTMNTPQVRLIAERNRIGAVLDIVVRERILGGRWSGKLDFDAALRWEPRDSTLRLFQARVADLKLTSAGSDVRTPAERLGAALAERALEDMVLYTLPAERAEALRARGLSPGGVMVTSQGVEVSYAPASR